nr:MAG TPA: hypothetical protein [Caudoviricetes sp.]
MELIKCGQGSNARHESQKEKARVYRPSFYSACI